LSGFLFLHLKNLTFVYALLIFFLTNIKAMNKSSIGSLFFLFSCLAWLSSPIKLYAQLPENLVFRDAVYQDVVQTVLLHQVDDQLEEPMILLNDQLNKLKLSFDMLGDYAYTYQFTLIHCTHDWKPSQLQQIEYIQGFEEERIDQYRFSLNTITPYVHYDVLLPSSQMLLTKSGNYLLVVYEDELTADQLVLSRRLMVVDPQVGISAKIPQYARKLSEADRKQQVDVVVGATNFFFDSPKSTVNLLIKQNFRWDNAVEGLKPNYVYPDALTFEYEDETLFEGANQFRYFDMKSFRYQSENIERIFEEPDYFTVRLWPDKRRVFEDYLSEQDINGRKFIKARDDQDTDIEGDYAWVEFFLQADAPFTHEDVYIIGALNDWNLDEKNKMTYNFKRKGYQAALFLKQGYYNYLYGVVERGERKAFVEPIEGSHWDTNNLYAIYLYYTKPGTGYDQLIGTAVIPSHP